MTVIPSPLCQMAYTVSVHFHLPCFSPHTTMRCRQKFETDKQAVSDILTTCLQPGPGILFERLYSQKASEFYSMLGHVLDTLAQMPSKFPACSATFRRRIV